MGAGRRAGDRVGALKLGTVVPPERTIEEILERAGATKRQRPGRRASKGIPYPAPAARRAGEVVQVDFVGPRHLDGGVRFHALNQIAGPRSLPWSLPVKSVLQAPPALAQPPAGLIGAALLGLAAIARQRTDRLLEPPLGLLACAFRSLLASASGHVGLLDQVLALGRSPARHAQS